MNAITTKAEIRDLTQKGAVAVHTWCGSDYDVVCIVSNVKNGETEVVSIGSAGKCQVADVLRHLLETEFKDKTDENTK